ncbi:MAG: tRNA (guanosine(46)-N7)-methyltransferase TrmB [Alphaproteobacteria bacterium]|nr:tRNA (guanosine(46)-N7)-methyltransferase TrmB [Alphaproteobacteria bacterium]
MNEGQTPSPQRVFGRRKGRPLRVRKSRLMDELYPKLKINLPQNGTISPQEIFQNASPASVWVEIGFGGGEHLAAQAKLHPDVRFIGCEPFINGVASLLDHLERENIENVRIYGDDARRMLDALPDACVDKCFVLFADPWPKKRHAERRFIGAENLVRLARVLKPGGILRLASDDAQLVAWMRERLSETLAFACVYDRAEPPPDWIETRYREKAVRAGRIPVFMDYRRTSSSSA